MGIQRALVTGASAGIGRAIAVDLARRGADLVLVARDEGRLEELAADLATRFGADVEVLPADLTRPRDREAVEARVAAAPEVDCVVNNAGIGNFGPITRHGIEAEQRVVELNVTALLRLTQVAAQTFNARRRGFILNVSSLASYQPAPFVATYAATKAFVTSLTQGVRGELEGTGVHVTLLCPGYTHTEIHERNGWEVGGLPSFVWTEADDVARAAVDALLADRAVVVPGAATKALVAVAQVSPHAVSRRVARYTQVMSAEGRV